MDKKTLTNHRFLNRPTAIHPDRLDALLATEVNLREIDFKSFFDFDEENDNNNQKWLLDEIKIIEIFGPLVSGKLGFIDRIFGYQSYDDLKEEFRAAIDDSSVKGILFNINSPGGEPGGMFDLSDEIYESRGSKPVWAIANEHAYSAAYGIASAADRIYLTKTGGVGSVGVIAAHVEISQYNKGRGFNYTLFRGGKYKAETNPFEPLTQHAKDSVQSEVDRIYTMFVELVARNRSSRLSEDRIRESEAGVFHGEIAVNEGFADRLGNFETVIQEFSEFLNKEEDDMSQENKNQNQAQEPKQRIELVMSENAPKETAQANQPQASQPQGQVIDLDKVREEERQKAKEEYKAYIQEVTELCSLADCPQRAQEFIEKETKISEVRRALIDDRAKRADANQVDTFHGPSFSSDNPQKPVIDTNKVYHQLNQYKAE